ncbi:MAG: RIO1 family regulatory kinase/ATPase domain-containing protein [Planctomycetota bacterium]|jgi:RIO kinase 1
MPKKRHQVSALTEGDFKRELLRDFEREHLLDTFKTYVSEVLQPINDGKEATVYPCLARPSTGAKLFAAKVYRARKFRAFRKDRAYYLNRHCLDGRMARAMKSGTQRGRTMSHQAWIQSEWNALRQLYAGGADVPEPLALSDNAILMEFIGDETKAAPMLAHVKLGNEEGRQVFHDLLRNIETFLACDLVHGDLSAFNVLYWRGRAVIIDVPQAIDLRQGKDNLPLLMRDVRNLCTYFAKQGVFVDADSLAIDLWTRYVNMEI